MGSIVVKIEDGIDLPEGDFRRARRYLAPWLFAGGEEGTTYPPPSDLMTEDRWDNVMTLPTDVALKTSSYEGTAAGRLAELHSDWIFSWPEVGTAPFMDEACLVAGEEFDALVFNALHGYFRQAIGCLRNALEVMTVAAGLAVTANPTLFTEWRERGEEITFGQARAWLRDSTDGKRLDAEMPGDRAISGETAWLARRYRQLCAYAHSRSGYNNVDMWEGSNGPIFVPQSLYSVEREFRETLALSYLLLRLGWQGYTPRDGPAKLLAGGKDGWGQFERLLRRWLL